MGVYFIYFTYLLGERWRAGVVCKCLTQTPASHNIRAHKYKVRYTCASYLNSTSALEKHKMRETLWTPIFTGKHYVRSAMIMRIIHQSKYTYVYTDSKTLKTFTGVIACIGTGLSVHLIEGRVYLRNSFSKPEHKFSHQHSMELFCCEIIV